MDPWTVLSAVTVGTAVALACSTVMNPIVDEKNGVDAERRKTLMAQSAVVRYTPYLFDIATFFVARFAPNIVTRVAAQLELLPPTVWRADEYIGARIVHTVAIAVAGTIAVGTMFGLNAGLIAGCVLLLALPPLLMNTLAKAAKAHVSSVRERLPFALDLMALLLAGSCTLVQAVTRTALANKGLPLGDEFDRLLKGIDQLGDPVTMFKALDRRMADEDVRQLALTASTAIDRGIPLKDAFLRLANDMRTRRIQWMERSSERAKVRIIGPMYINMIGCLLVVVAPIILHALAK